MKITNVFAAFLLLVSCYFYSCQEDVADDAFYTFSGETVTSFCKGVESLSIFSQMVDESGYASLLSVYGHYTCFAPTNEAFEIYFRELGITYNDLRKEDKINLLNDHIIKGTSTEYLSESFQDGEIPTPNMNDRYLLISFRTDETTNKQVIWVNKSAPIEAKDNEIHNGVVHIVGRVVKPSQDNLLAVMQEVDHFKLFAEAFEKTNLIDSISEIYDYSYVDPSPGVDFVNVVGYDGIAIHHNKKLGYTIFAETDEVFKKAGINNLNDLVEFAKRYYGSQDLDDYTSRDNPLNKFISYHILDRQLPANGLIYTVNTGGGKLPSNSNGNTASYAMDKRYEYYETLLKMRLMEIKAGNKINTRSNDAHVGVNELLSNLDAMNGYVHALTDVLVYDEAAMINDVLNKRIRMDAYAIPPQLTNNNIRWRNVGQSYTISPDFCGEHFKFNEATKIILWASYGWDDHQGDEISIRGWYDFTLRLPPVPPGTYEIRFGYSKASWRGIAQLFIDGEIVGIPIDLAIDGSDPRVGWIADSQTLDNGVENDKMMRNRGYMKSGNSIINESYGHLLRTAVNDLRVIVGTFTFQEYDYHTFRAKNVEREDGEFHLDFIEYVPVSHLDKEDRD